MEAGGGGRGFIVEEVEWIRVCGGSSSSVGEEGELEGMCCGLWWRWWRVGQARSEDLEVVEQLVRGFGLAGVGGS